MNILINGAIIAVIVLITNWLSTSFTIAQNDLINLFIWACVVGLFVGVGTRNFTWKAGDNSPIA